MGIIREISDDLSNDVALAPVYAAVREFDPVTYNHCERVGILAARFGDFLGYDYGDLRTLAIAGSLHDAGKHQMSEVILKPGSFTPDERRLMEQHPRITMEMLKGVGYEREARIVVGHHENQPRPYPRRIKRYRGEDRRKPDGRTYELTSVVAIADKWDGLTNGRPYKPPFPDKKAEEMMGKNFTGDDYMLHEFLKMTKWYRVQ
jgi:HD-GYP domain-containing protein (c-di-GMP phosphodiesterase class II)